MGERNGWDRISLLGMEFHGCHGCLPREREKAQLFRVDAVLLLDLSKAGKSDALVDTVNYAEVFEAVRRIVEGESLHLIEALAERIADELLKKYGLLQSVQVTVHKPEAPIPGAFRDVAVSIERLRQ